MYLLLHALSLVAHRVLSSAHLRGAFSKRVLAYKCVQCCCYFLRPSLEVTRWREAAMLSAGTASPARGHILRLVASLPQSASRRRVGQDSQGVPLGLCSLCDCRRYRAASAVRQASPLELGRGRDPRAWQRHG